MRAERLRTFRIYAFISMCLCDSVHKELVVINAFSLVPSASQCLSAK